MMSGSQHRYTNSMLVLHWLSLLFLIAIYSSIEFRVVFEKGTAERDLLKDVHFVLGLTLWLITLVRLAMRHLSVIPPIDPLPPKLMMRLSALVHGALYSLLLLMPVLGYLLLSAGGQLIPFWGLQLPALIDTDPLLATRLKQLHQWLGQAGYGVIALHALGALLHHALIKDNTLKRMLPVLFSKKG